MKPTNIIDVLEELGVPCKTAGEHGKVTSRNVGIDCPFCGHEDYYMGLLVSGRGVAHCWQCGRHGVAKALVEASRRSWSDVLALLHQLDSYPDYDDFPEVQRRRLVLPRGLGPMTDAHRAYLAERPGGGFDAEELERLWGLQGVGDGPSGSLRWSVFIPVTYRGETVSWTTRSINPNATRRYVSAAPDQERLPAKELLMGEDYCRMAVVLVEGPFGMFRIGPGAAASLGVGVKDAQVLLRLTKFPLRVVCFDSEPAAQERAREVCDRLEPFSGRTVRVELDAAQPDLASPAEVARLRRTFLD